MTWWEGIVLGVVQGLTEFLPISSSGHLVVAQATLGMQAPGVVIEVALHVATLLAVVIVYAKTLGRLTVGVMKRNRDDLRYVGLLVVATVPAAFAGVFFKGFFEQAFDRMAIVGIDFLITGTILWSTKGRIRAATKETFTARQAGGIGVAQALAIMPGISRSGTTVSAAIWLGIDPVKAAEFSFLMALPTIAGAAVLQLPDLDSGLGVAPGSLALSFVVALVSGVAAIRLLLALLQRRAFHHFAPYCWLLGLVTVTWGIVAA